MNAIKHHGSTMMKIREAERDGHGRKQELRTSSQILKSFEICQDQLMIQLRGVNADGKQS